MILNVGMERLLAAVLQVLDDRRARGLLHLFAVTKEQPQRCYNNPSLHWWLLREDNPVV